MGGDVKVCVTGGQGFVGSAIVRALNQQHPEWSICVLDIRPSSAEGPLVETCIAQSVEFFEADITHPDLVCEALETHRPDAVIHTAGFVPNLHERYLRRLESECRRINVTGTRNMLKAAQAVGCKGFVYTSSCTAVTDDWRLQYPNIDETWPTAKHSTIYGESKAMAEELVLAANDHQTFPTCVLRPSVIFGEGDAQLMPPNYACIAKGETPFVIGSGMNLWDMVYVGNVADAHVLAVENLLSSRTAAGECFFIQNNEPITFRDFQLAIWRNFDHTPPFEFKIPVKLGWVLGFLAEWATWMLGTTTTLSRGSVLDACAVRYASGKKAQAILGYEPKVGLEEGLRRSCKEYARRLKCL